MRRKWIVVLSVCVVILSGTVFSAEAETANFTGTVVGTDGSPIEGANLELYLVSIDQASMSYHVRSVAKTTSDAEGKFSFAVQRDTTSGYSMYLCLVQKKGLSCSWATAISTRAATWTFTLGEPTKLSGFVKNPDGTAVGEAEIRLIMLSIPGNDQRFMLGFDPIRAFVTKTCSDGRFEFDNLPKEATAEFLVKKPGKGTLHTLNTNLDPESGLTYKPGQEDIILKMQDACSISGMVVAKADQKSIGGIPIMARDSRLPINLTGAPVLSDADGVFEITDLAPGNYTLMVQSDDWIAKPVQLDVQSDTGTKIELTKGGTLEVKVVDSETKEPVSDAQVSMRCDDTRQYQHAATDASGMVKKQLLPGTYRIGAYKQRFRSVNDAVTTVVTDGQTSQVTIELGGQPKIAGTVTDADGNPVEGAVVHLVPGWGPRRDAVETDEKGLFTLEWDPGQMGWTEGEFYLIATHVDKQLAGVIQIAEDAKEATIKLEKGISAKGKIVNEAGEPIGGAKVILQFMGSRFSGTMGMEIQSGSDGEYVFGPLAADQRYIVSVQQATGYGTGQQDIQPASGEEQMTIKDIVLRVADQKVTGQVVDVDGNGLADVQLHCYGNGQPNVNTKSDSKGNFVLENVCSGEININANYRVNNDYQYGNVRAEGGAEGVKIIVTARGGRQRFVPKQPKSLVGQPLPDLREYGVDIPADANSVLVFVWDMNQRPSRHFIKELAGKADLLKKKEVTVMLLSAAAAEQAKIDGWLKEKNINYPCGIIAEDVEDVEDVKYKMGVQGLPWLILTDTERKVIAEGFGVNELEEKLNGR